VLTDVYESRDLSDAAIAISPLGTKLQAAGVYMFFERNRPAERAQVVYACPLVYNRLKYTVDFERTVLEYAILPQ
jgi:hypothetical protein